MQYGASADLLSRLPLFSGLGNDTLLSIVQRCDIRPFSAGQVLSLADSPADAAILIIEGEVALHNAQGSPVGETRGPGAMLDEMAMFVTTDHFLGAVALSNGALLELSRHVFGQILAEQPALAHHFAQSTRQNLVRMADTLRELDSMLMQSEQLLKALPAKNEKPDAPRISSYGQVNGSRENEQPDVLTPFGPREALSGLAGRAAAASMNGEVKNGNGQTKNKASWSQQASDLIAQLNAAITPSDQTPRVQEHDQTAFPNRVLRQSHEEPLPKTAMPGSPRHDQVAGRDSTAASHGRDSSTK